MPMNRSEAAIGPLTGISSMATRHVLHELANLYAGRCGRRVRIESVGGVDAARRVAAGEPFDFVVLAGDAIDRLAAAGHVEPGSRVDLARSSVAIAVARGAPHPDPHDEAAIRRAVLAARSVGYSTGPSGAYVVGLFERWGIAQAIAPRLVKAPPGTPVGALIARGEVDLGFQQLSELIGLPGIDVVGVLPREIQAVTVFAAAICASCKQPDAARDLLSFLGSPEGEAVRRRYGMEAA